MFYKKNSLCFTTHIAKQEHVHMRAVNFLNFVFSESIIRLHLTMKLPFYIAYFNTHAFKNHMFISKTTSHYCQMMKDKERETTPSLTLSLSLLSKHSTTMIYRKLKK